MKNLTGGLMVAGALLAGLVSLLGAVAGILSFQQALAADGVPYAAGVLAGHLVVAVLLFIFSQKLMRAGKARLGAP